MNTHASPPHTAPYRLIKKIGQGGMSVVYEAFDERLKRPVALKLLHPFLAEAPEYKARFLREAEAVARLTHPNIVQIYDVCDNQELYIVTELINGQTLKDKAEPAQFLETPELSAMIISQIAKALAHAHSKGIIHRDIKPENIMVTNEGQLKLMDFGIASISNDENLTQAGTLLGSLAHIAPEVIQGKASTPQSDIYSLNTVFFWLVTGELPFKADTPHALLKAIVDQPVVKIQQLSAYISDSLALIIERGMHKDPSKRFESAEEFAVKIEEALLEMSVVFDLNKLSALLAQRPLKLDNFKHTMFENMKSQALIYEQQGHLVQALALQCRLEAASAQNIIKLPAAKNKIYKKLFVAISALSICALVIYYLLPPPATPSTKVLLATEQAIESSEFIPSPPPTPVAPPPSPPAPVPAPTPPAAPKSSPVQLQELSVTIWPFATISVDGIIIAHDVKHKKIKLEPGIHRLKFMHTYAATVEKIVHIKNTKETLELAISMHKTKPAFLTVKAHPEADVAIDGIFKGPSSKSLRDPIVVRMPDKTHAIHSEVIIQRDGFKPVVKRVQFIAGQSQEIHLSLMPLEHL